jgi:hypothetical protein
MMLWGSIPQRRARRLRLWAQIRRTPVKEFRKVTQYLRSFDKNWDEIPRRTGVKSSGGVPKGEDQ